MHRHFSRDAGEQSPWLKLPAPRACCCVIWGEPLAISELHSVPANGESNHGAAVKVKVRIFPVKAWIANILDFVAYTNE